MNRTSVFWLLLLFFALPITAHAFTEETVGGSLVANVFPESPDPFGEVVIELDTTPASFIGASIDWIVNDIPVATPAIPNILAVRLGDSGSVTRIIAVVTRREALPVTKIIQINPGSVNVLVDPVTYTPYGYRGAPRASEESKVRLTAFPILREEGGISLRNSDLLFTWSENNEVFAEELGLSSVTIDAPLSVGSKNITVTVENNSRSISARGDVALEPVSPEIIFYQEHPTQGTLHQRALNTQVVDEQEIDVRAEPYFFSFGDNLDFRWSVNNEQLLPRPEDPTLLTLRTDADTLTEAALSLIIENTVNLFQQASRTLLLRFGPRRFDF